MDLNEIIVRSFRPLADSSIIKGYGSLAGLVLTYSDAQMCNDERKCSVMKSAFVMMNYEETKNWYVRVEREM